MILVVPILTIECPFSPGGNGRVAELWRFLFRPENILPQLRYDESKRPKNRLKVTRRRRRSLAKGRGLVPQGSFVPDAPVQQPEAKPGKT